MKRLKGILVLVLLLALLASPVAVLASDISGARYYALIQISNNGTAVTNVATTCNISTTNLINGGYLNSSANNCALQSSAGAGLAFMPGITDDPWTWSIWVPSIGADSIITDILYTANSTGGKIRYFPSDDGMATVDSGTLELGDNFTVEQSGWINTDNGTDKNAVFKSHSFRTFVSPTVSGNITSELGVEGLDFIPNDWASIPDHADFSFTDGNDLPFSIVVWFNPDDLNVVGNIVSKLDIAPAAQFEWRLWNAADAIQFNTYHLDATKIIGRKTGDASGYEDSWTHLVGTYDGSEASAGFNIYLNSVDSDTTDSEVLAYTGMGDGTSKVLLGARDDGGSEFYNGQIAEIKIYSVELTPAEVLADMGGEHKPTDLVAWYELEDGAGNPTDSSANGHNADSNIAVWFDDIVSVTATGVTSGEHEIKTSANTTHLIINIDDRDTPFESHTTGDTTATYAGQIEGTGWVGQTFTPDTPHIIASVKLKLYRVGSPGIVTVSIRATDGSGHPTGADLCVGTTDGDTLPTGAPYEWREIMLGSGTPLLADTEYAIAVRVLDCTGEDRLAWRVTSSGNPYPNGNQVFSINSGGDWNSQEGEDLLFEEWAFSAESSVALNGASVDDSGIDWVFCQNNSIIYLEEQEITIDGVLQQHIKWEYDTTFTDLSGNNHDATPSFRGASSDADVSAELISFRPVREAKAPAFVLEEAPAFIEDVPVIVSDFDVSPDPAAGEFPLAGVIAVVASATDTPAQLPLVIIAGFVIIALSLTISGIMRKYGSGTVFVKVLVIAAIMGVFVAIGNFGIDFWMIFIFLIIGVALSMASRHVSWQ